jgi:uncharacterized BrkB/YihY/UPF0761 family membrane protein
MHEAGLRKVSRPRRAYDSAYQRGSSAYGRGLVWVEGRDPGSFLGMAVGWARRYRAADGQLYAVVLAAYFFLTAVPFLLVESSYVYNDPTALAHRLEHRLALGPETSKLLTGVMAGAAGHQLTAALIAVVNVFFFGAGFGRVLQLAHARSWGIDLRKNVLVDQLRYFEVVGGVFVLTLLFVVQSNALRSLPSWAGWLLTAGWLVVLVGYFVWAPHLLLHRRVRAKDILPGALFAVAGLVAMRVISGLVLKRWLDSYSRTYGALGIVIAIFFWIVIFATILILAAGLSPSLAHRRDVLRSREPGS